MKSERNLQSSMRKPRRSLAEVFEHHPTTTIDAHNELSVGDDVDAK